MYTMVCPIKPQPRFVEWTCLRSRDIHLAWKPWGRLMRLSLVTLFQEKWAVLEYLDCSVSSKFYP
jgi:hypothetical protein